MPMYYCSKCGMCLGGSGAPDHVSEMCASCVAVKQQQEDD